MIEIFDKYLRSLKEKKSSLKSKFFRKNSLTEKRVREFNGGDQKNSCLLSDSTSEHSKTHIFSCISEDLSFAEKCRSASFYRDAKGTLMFDSYEIIEILGTGKDTKILLAEGIYDMERVALKVMKMSSTDNTTEVCLNNEVQALNAVAHRNVLKLKKVYYGVTSETQIIPFEESTVLVLEHCEGGDFFDLVSYSGFFSEKLARTYFLQLVEAIAACHDKNLYHRDIKLQNILLGENFKLKLADFGVCTRKKTDSDLCDSVCGTFGYMAPEVLSGIPYSGEKADSWSLGVLLFYLLSGNPPMKVAMKVDWWFNALLSKRYDEFWESHAYISPDFPEEAREIVSQLLRVDPKERTTVREILRHPWLQGPTLSDNEINVEMTERLEKIQLSFNADC